MRKYYATPPFLHHRIPVLLHCYAFVTNFTMAKFLLVGKPTEEDSTIIAVEDTSAADHVNVDDVCMAHIRAEDLKEPQTSTFFENVYDKSSYDLGNITNKILSDNEKRQILDMGPLQPSRPLPTVINQNNRCFPKTSE
ncbi:hypothetical protein EVAR_85089_1 [Eumeta japonica]|uniref:Uncharacterized protein n=1 Tax=Eumeta variegata TaxID=151549 RepID=A0A4C1XBP2_EUMVA|nr:hypothetical protein EVAR_85089_1 [Eumeta japonica]